MMFRKGSVQYALVVGLIAGTLASTQLQPLGWRILSASLALQLGVGSVIAWRRTGFPFFTAGLAIGSATFILLFVFASRGQSFPQIGPAGILAVVAGLTLALAGLAVESRVHDPEWKRFREFQREASFLDHVLFRHIPNLRGSGGRP